MLTQSSCSLQKLSRLWLVFAGILWASAGSIGIAQGATVAPKELPVEMAQWEANMKAFGERHCAALNSNLDEVRYDAERVYYQIAAHPTMDPTAWQACINKAEALYRDMFIRPDSPIIVPGDWVYSNGLRMDYLKATDTVSATAVHILATQSQYANAPAADTEPYSMSPEVAWLLMAYVDDWKLTGVKPDRYDTILTQALGHIHQWYVVRDWEKDPTLTGMFAFPHVPWMVGLTMQALIHAHTEHPDSRIPDAIKMALDGLWGAAWLAGAQSFYANSIDPSSNPVWNLLIAPAYAWYFYETGPGNDGSGVVYRDRADDVFRGGVQQAAGFLNDPDNAVAYFNANYSWSFRYPDWRTAANDRYKPVEDPNASPVCDRAWARPSMLWPPNHRMMPIYIGGIADPDKDPISLKLTVEQDEPVKGLGRHDKSPDMDMRNGILYLRAERSKRGDGREYTIHLEAEDGRNGKCTKDLKVKVPKRLSKFHHWNDDDDDDDDRDSKHGRHKDNDRHDGKKNDRDDDRNSKKDMKRR